jgi:hypothetical protein
MDERRQPCLPGDSPPRPPRSELGVPVTFGYVRIPASWPAVAGMERIRTLEAVARRCGWVLGEAFVEDEPDRPLLAYRHLRAAVRDDSAPVAVLVVSETEFADAVEESRALRTDLERVTGVPVVITSILRLPDESPPVTGRAPGWAELIVTEAPGLIEADTGGAGPPPRRAR